MKSEMKVDRDFIFPCLGIRDEEYTDTDTYDNGVQRNITIIVLFTEENIGTVVYVKDFLKTYFLGEYCTTWDMERFEPFHGEVTIK